MSGRLKQALVAVAVVLVASPALAVTYYVPDDFTTIQAALDAATDIYTTTTIIVRDDTYTGAGNKNLDFEGKALTLRSENGAENCIIDCQGVGRGFYFHSGEGSSSIIDGFTVTNGLAAGDWPANNGGAIYCADYSSPTISNCIISNNSAYRGAGISCLSYSSPTIENCTFLGNSADLDAGGIYCSQSSAVIVNCEFSNNSAVYGGAIHCTYNSSPSVIDCVIDMNFASLNGGGIYSWYSSPTITYCTVTGNSALNEGGGVACYYSLPNSVNSILWGDTASYGPEIALAYNSSLSVSYSDVEGGQASAHVASGCTLDWGGGNINANPLFVDGGNYHLASGSPCIDSGIDAGIYTDIDGDTRPQGESFDMGSDEYVLAKGDISGDGNVNSGDGILALRIAAGLPIGNPPHLADATERSCGDVNCDGSNDSGDAILILRYAAALITAFPCGG